MSRDNALYDKARKALEDNYPEAKELLADPKSLAAFAQKADIKLVEFPAEEPGLSDIPVLIAMVKEYCEEESRHLSKGTMTEIVAALLYWISADDIIPDSIPMVGMIDDAAVIKICIENLGPTVAMYKKRRMSSGVPSI